MYVWNVLRPDTCAQLFVYGEFVDSQTLEGHLCQPACGTRYDQHLCVELLQEHEVACWYPMYAVLLALSANIARDYQHLLVTTVMHTKEIEEILFLW